MDNAHDRLRGRMVVASVSGGKDSTAMALHLRELNIPFRPVFMDTGWESSATYAYIDEVLEPLIGPIVRLRSARGGMAEWVRHKAMFPSRLRRFCTERLKVMPLLEYLRGLDEEVVNAVGIRAAESAARAGLPEWEWSEGLDCEVYRPIIAWSEQDVIDIHARHGVRPNPLYLAGARRVGCWPCIFARKAEIRLVADMDPGRIDLIRDMEADLTAPVVARAKERAATPWPADLPTAAEARAALLRAAGVTATEEAAARALDAVLREAELRDPDAGRNRRTFFHGRGRDGLSERGIDEMVQWARTARGGAQLLLFDDEPEGCVRWGLCEPHAETEE